MYGIYKQIKTLININLIACKQISKKTRQK